jgi:hypothetical protein
VIPTGANPPTNTKTKYVKFSPGGPMLEDIVRRLEMAEIEKSAQRRSRKSAAMTRGLRRPWSTAMTSSGSSSEA